MVASIGVSMVLRHLIYIFADINGLLNVKARVLTQPVMFIGYGRSPTCTCTPCLGRCSLPLGCTSS